MLMVAPNGRVKLVILVETPARLSTDSMVSDKVAPEEEVEKAVSSALRITLKCNQGFTFPINFSSNGKLINAWKNNALNTVNMYKPMLPASAAKSLIFSATVCATIPKIPIGVNFMITW